MEGAEQPFLVWTDHKNLEYVHGTEVNFRQDRGQFKARDGPHDEAPILLSDCRIRVVTWECGEEGPAGTLLHS